MVKASLLSAGDPGFDSRLRRGNYFPGQVTPVTGHTSDRLHQGQITPVTGHTSDRSHQ